MNLPDDLSELLLARTRRDEQTGCLRWLGAKNHKGYGSISIDGRTRPVHRVAHEVWIGPIPDGHDIDHVAAKGCRHRDCIEPDHLEAVTHHENLRRAMRPRTHCVNGHELTPDNVVESPARMGGVIRLCRTCKKVHQQRWKAKRRQEATR